MKSKKASRKGKKRICLKAANSSSDSAHTLRRLSHKRICQMYFLLSLFVLPPNGGAAARKEKKKPEPERLHSKLMTVFGWWCVVFVCVASLFGFEKSRSARDAAHILHFHFRLTIRGSMRVWRTPNRCSPLSLSPSGHHPKHKETLQIGKCAVRARVLCMCIVYLLAGSAAPELGCFAYLTAAASDMCGRG